MNDFGKFPSNNSGDPYKDAYEFGGTDYDGLRRRRKRVRLGTAIMIGFIALMSGVLISCFVFSPQIESMLSGTTREDTIMPEETPVSTSRIRIIDPTPQPTERAVPPLGSLQAPNDEIYSSITADIAEQVCPSVVGIFAIDQGDNTHDGSAGAGSGIILSPDGYIVTNNHVIEGFSEIYVKLDDGEELPAEIMGKDKFDDLAVIKIDKTGLTPISIGDSNKVRVGETAIAIGNPLGNLGGTVTQGIISAINRAVYIESDNVTRYLIQTDAAINPGNSGGALVNLRGQLIGINTLKTMFASSDPYGMPISVEGIGFAIPVNDVMPVVSELIKSGYVSRPGLGVMVTEISKEIAEQRGFPPGLVVSGVTDKGAAQKAGIMVGDIIVSADGNPTLTTNDLLAYIRSHAVGQSIRFTVFREGNYIDFDVVLEDMNEMNARAKPN